MHNRVTRRMPIWPFSLGEAESYLRYLGILWARREIAEAYMAFGGIPFYLNQLRPGMSLAQNIDELCFERDAFMKGEFYTLFVSLFQHADRHVKVIEALCGRGNGMFREELLDAAGIKSGGVATGVLEELEQCGFVGRYRDFSGKSGRFLYHVTDFFTLFYMRFMRSPRAGQKGYWTKTAGKGAYHDWAGKSFEKLCFLHFDCIARKLGIFGMAVAPYAWKCLQSSDGGNGAQIDMLIDRPDGIINVCECRFTNAQYSIDKSQEAELRERMAVFARETKTRKALHLTMVTAYGVRAGKYSGIVQSEVVLDDLFG
ncbi:MAG: hypothetical protein LBR77_03910 [Lachnospiraceae bacterium]|nr:hypothetical protein [Lachnospiraceae bacterium]